MPRRSTAHNPRRNPVSARKVRRLLAAVADVRWRLARLYTQVEKLERDLAFVLKERA